MATYDLSIPISEDAIRALHVGDTVRLSGVMTTGRDAAHKYMIENFIRTDAVPESGQPLYEELQRILREGVIYHCGPVVRQLPLAPPQSPPTLGGKAAPPQSPPTLGGKAPPPQSRPTFGGEAAPPQSPPTLGGRAAPPQSRPTLGGKAAPPQSRPTLGGKAAPPQSPPTLGGKAAPPQSRPTLGGRAAPPQSRPTLGGVWEFVAAGPTTSIREEVYEPEVIAHFGLRGVIGKGGMGPGTLRACREHGAVYFHAVGGAASLIADAVKEVVAVYKKDEFGVPEAFWVIRVEDFPLIVTMDSHGRSIHDEVEAMSREALRRLITAT